MIVRALEHPWEDPKEMNTSGCIWGEEAGGGQGPEGRRVEKGKGSGETFTFHWVTFGTSCIFALRFSSPIQNK